MEKDIKISVVVPIYNVQNYLEKCIESIMKQSYRNIEIILVDDGSTDRSSEICDYYAAEDNRIRVIHKKNGGLVSARKVGTTVASGDYILNVDGDDWIDQDRIEVLVLKGIKAINADMIYMHGYTVEHAQHSKEKFCNILEEKTYYGDEIEKYIFPLMCGEGEMLFNKQMAHNAVFWAIKRELLKENQPFVDDRISVGEDFILVWICLLSSKYVTVIKQAGYHYVQRDSSIIHMAESYRYNSIKDFNIIYHQLKLFIIKYSSYPKKTRAALCRVLIMSLMLCCYDMFLKKHTDFLYPFSEVKKGSRIVVYGAGKMGSSLMRCLIKSKDYNVTLWVDKNKQKSLLSKFEISSIEDIKRVDYDYVVIAIADAKISYEVRKNLISIGISKEKIARINPEMIAEDALPEEILNGKYIE